MKNKKDQSLGGSDSAGSAIPERGKCYCRITNDYIIEYCPLHGAAPELLAACIVVKAYLGNLEAGTDDDDPLMEMRRQFHGPLLAKLDPAIAKATATPATSDAPAAQSGIKKKG